LHLLTAVGRATASALFQLLGHDRICFGDEILFGTGRDRRTRRDVVATAVAADGTGGLAHDDRQIKSPSHEPTGATGRDFRLRLALLGEGQNRPVGIDAVDAQRHARDDADDGLAYLVASVEVLEVVGALDAPSFDPL
jgi:hypothetical protein